MVPYYEQGGVTIYHGDCLEVMRAMPDGCVDAIVTDPPYGLSFMGKRWDYDVPAVAVWREALRVLKPGGHLISFGGSRTYHRLVVNVEDAGFEVRDQIIWMYGSGFPKSLNIGDGLGTALKPAHEPAVLARRPLEGTVAQNVQAYGTGAMNVDGCRVSHYEECRMMSAQIDNDVMTGNGKYGQAGRRKDVLELKPSGRWPANLIHDGSPEVLAVFPVAYSAGNNSSLKRHPGGGVIYGVDYGGQPKVQHDDTVSAARFFYCAKASQAERGPGNTHPTVKPIELMRYLCRLVTPPGGVVLDPFCGSGTTGIAARLEGFQAVLCDSDTDSINITVSRLGCEYVVNDSGGAELKPKNQDQLSLFEQAA